MSSYTYTPSQVGGIIRVTDKATNNARLSLIAPSDGFKRLSLRPTSVDFFSLYGKFESKSRPGTATLGKSASGISVTEKEIRPATSRMSSYAKSVRSVKSGKSIESEGSDSEKTLCGKRESVASMLKKRASRVFS